MFGSIEEGLGYDEADLTSEGFETMVRSVTRYSMRQNMFIIAFSTLLSSEPDMYLLLIYVIVIVSLDTIAAIA